MDEKEKMMQLIDSYYESWFEINHLYQVWAKKHGMHDTTLFTLYVIHAAETNCTQNQICNKLCLPKQTVSQILYGLEKDGYIIRVPNEKDRRNKIVQFTEKGQTFASSILSELQTAEIAAFQQISKEQRQSIIDNFTLLSDALTKSLS